MPKLTNDPAIARRKQHNIHTFIYLCREINKLYEYSNLELEDIIAMCSMLDFSEEITIKIRNLFNAIK